MVITGSGYTEAEALAMIFHDAYERLAPDFGYRTREASAKPWKDVPEQNRALMVATCGEVLGALAAAGRLLPADTSIEWAIRVSWDDPAREPGFYYHFPDEQAAARQLDRERGYWRSNSAGRFGAQPDRFEVMWRYVPRRGPWVPVDPKEQQP